MGGDISAPAQDTKEAIQWLYFAYLAAVKEQNGAAMSLGRTSTFLDIYAERDLKEDVTPKKKLRNCRSLHHEVEDGPLLRTPAYDELFSGDPTWVTESIGGMADGRHMVTKHELPLPAHPHEPWTRPGTKYDHFVNTIPASGKLGLLPRCPFKPRRSSDESDNIMLEQFGDDYGIACCVSR